MSEQAQVGGRKIYDTPEAMAEAMESIRLRAEQEELIESVERPERTFEEESIVDKLIDQSIMHDEEIDFKLDVEKKNQVSLEQTQTKEHQTTDVRNFAEEQTYEIVDLTDSQKTMNAKAREYMETWAKVNGYDGAIDFWMKKATSGIDKLFINEKWGKGDHDALDKYLRHFANVLGIQSDTEKVKIITDIRRKGDDLFSR